jgi:hypothetical protein
MTLTHPAAFEDVIDGYFPLRESLRQMLKRKACKAALVSIRHAPAMEIPGIQPTDPVPLYITDGFGCIIHSMTLLARLTDAGTTVTGVADWSWSGTHRAQDTAFSDMNRLAEPALIRGLALSEIPEKASLTELQRPMVLSCKNPPAGGVVKGSAQIMGRSILFETPDSRTSKLQKTQFFRITKSQNAPCPIFGDLSDELQAGCATLLSRRSSKTSK